MTHSQSLGDAAGEPLRGGRLWLCVALVALIAAGLQSYGIATWPMADDEVPTLVEMGLLKVDPQAFSVPESQIGRLPRAIPVWYGVQRFAIEHLPRNVVFYRLPSVVFGVLTSVLVFFVAARWRGFWFAAALALVMNSSQLFVYLAQLNRFYSMPMLLMTATFILMWAPWPDAIAVPAVVALAVLSVLSHNITVGAFGLALGASCVLYVFKRVPLRLVVRSAAAALPAVLLYGVYLRPLLRGWNSTGNPTPVLISFTAHLGIPFLALALLGGCLIALRRDNAVILWWLLIFVATLGLLQFAPVTWNPRYFLFFLPGAWVLAAYAMDSVGERLGYRIAGVAWFGCVMLLIAPNIASHYIDGTRHDYREAARVVIAADQTRDPILSDDAETISYYLPEELRHNLFVRTKVTEPPASTFFLVTRANAWTPLPRLPGRQMQLLAEIYRRRVDQFSHILRVYRVSPIE